MLNFAQGAARERRAVWNLSMDVYCMRISFALMNPLIEEMHLGVCRPRLQRRPADVRVILQVHEHGVCACIRFQASNYRCFCSGSLCVFAPGMAGQERTGAEPTCVRQRYSKVKLASGARQLGCLRSKNQEFI